MTEHESLQESAPKPTRRDELISRIAGRLSEMDEGALGALEEWVDGRAEVALAGTLPMDGASSSKLSRRQFLGTLAIGSAALVASNTATAIVTWDRGSQQGERDMEIKLMPTVTRLEDLVTLYERLEGAGLDDAVSGGLAGITPLLRVLREGSKLLLLGIGVAELALAQVEKAQDKVREGIDFVQRIVDSLEEKVAGLWSLLGEVTGVAVPIADAIGEFFGDILEKIPFGIGAKIQQIIDWMQDLIAQLPEALATTKVQLLGPLRLEWFDADSEESLDARLFKPVREELLSPAKNLVAELERLDADWETVVRAPIEAALAERAAVRQEILAFTGEQGHLA